MALDEPLRQCARCAFYNESCSKDCNFRVAFPPHTGTGSFGDVFTFKRIAEIFRNEFLNGEFAGMPLEETSKFRKTLEFICDALSKNQAGGPLLLVEEYKRQLASANEKKGDVIEEVIRLENLIHTFKSEQVELKDQAEKLKRIRQQNEHLSADVSNAHRKKAEIEKKLKCAENDLKDLEVCLSNVRKTSVGTGQQFGHECEHSSLEIKMLEIEDAIKALPDVSSIERMKQDAIAKLESLIGGNNERG